MRKLLIAFALLTMTLAASAQFEEGKMYTSASLSGLDLNYSGAKEFHLDVSAKGGYCFMDNWMALAQAGVSTDQDATALKVGVGARYYIIQNGIYLGVNAAYKHSSCYNDFMPGVEVGYAFFINRHCTIEPAIYYDQSTKCHKDYSTVGFRIGFGIYM